MRIVETLLATSLPVQAKLPISSKTWRPRSQLDIDLSLQQPHHPARHKNSAQEHHKAISTVADHFTGIVPMRDTEHDGGEEREHKRCTEVIKSNRH
jgi:hypothetical protein